MLRHCATLVGLAVVCGGTVACAAGDSPSPGGGGEASTTTTSSSTTTTGVGGGTGGFVPGGGQGGTPAVSSDLYVHSNETLFVADPATSPLSLQQIGDFDCIGGTDEDYSMNDIAVDRNGDLWTVSANKAYRLEVDGATVHCAEIIELNNPSEIRFYGLTFAPKGVLHPDEERLIAGNSAGELWEIGANGDLTQRGTFGIVPSSDGNGNSFEHAGKPWELSGDIAFADNSGSPVGFATVRDCPDPPSSAGCNEIDTLIELDVPALATATTQSVTKSVRGMLVRAGGCNDTADGYGRVYGIAAYQGEVLGFSRGEGDGRSITIDNVDGTACAIELFPGIPWAGAGITTLAPVVPPPPK